MDLAEKVAEIMSLNGLNSVKIYTNNQSSVSVRGKLGDRFTLVFKKDIPQDEQFVRLNDGNGMGTVMQWNESAPESLPLILKTAKVYVFPEHKELRQNTLPRWVIPTAIGTAAMFIGASGIYLGQGFWNSCRGSNQEVIQP
ncbi:MAG: hypothetical protein F6K31_19410 [Symploca sp. SIO2G7]|nr:hypothetical protein [Symploca sp. SIO2G7]